MSTPENPNKNTNSHENEGAQVPNLEKALGSIYVNLSDEQKADLAKKAGDNEDVRKTLSSMEAADLGAMLGNPEEDATAQLYSNLIDSILSRELPAPRVAAPNANDDPQAAPTPNLPAVREAALVPVDPAENADQPRASLKDRFLGKALYIYSRPFIWMGKSSSKYREAYNAANPEEKKRMEKKASLIGTVGAVALGALLYSAKATHLFGIFSETGSGSGAGGHEGANGEWDAPKAANGQDIVSEQQLDRYFNMPDTSTMTDKLHYANDFGPGSEALRNLDKAGFVHDTQSMFRGNENITAMWAAQLGIPGAPQMPSVDVLQNDPTALANFNKQVNAYGDLLHNDIRLRADVTNQLVDKLNNSSFGNKVTLNPGFVSPGANNGSQEIFGSKPAVPGESHEVFIDGRVNYTGKTAQEVIIDGKVYLVDPDCNQIDYQGPAPSAPSYSETYNIPTNSVPNHPNVPNQPSGYTPNTPGGNTPGGGTPGGGTPGGGTPDTPLAGKDHDPSKWQAPGRDDTTDSGVGEKPKVGSGDLTDKPVVDQDTQSTQPQRDPNKATPGNSSTSAPGSETGTGVGSGGSQSSNPNSGVGQSGAGESTGQGTANGTASNGL